MITKSAYKPRPEDIQWVQNLLASLPINGIYSYKMKPIFFTKTAEKEFTLTAVIETTEVIVGLDEELGRWQNVLEAAGIKFIDGR